MSGLRLAAIFLRIGALAFGEAQEEGASASYCGVATPVSVAFWVLPHALG